MGRRNSHQDWKVVRAMDVLRMQLREQVQEPHGGARRGKARGPPALHLRHVRKNVQSAQRLSPAFCQAPQRTILFTQLLRRCSAIPSEKCNPLHGT